MADATAAVPARARACDTLGGMCRQVTCPKCGKPGWAGCGAHVEQVLGHVHPDDRCSCNSAGKATSPVSAWLQKRKAAKAR